MEFMKINKLCRVSLWDKFLVGLLLLFSLFMLVSLKSPGTVAEKAVVYYKGKVIEEIDLKINGVRELKLGNGNMKLETDRGGIRVLESSCPHKICVNMGWIRNNGQALICVPNKVLVEIKGVGSKYDAVSY